MRSLKKNTVNHGIDKLEFHRIANSQNTEVGALLAERLPPQADYFANPAFNPDAPSARRLTWSR